MGRSLLTSVCIYAVKGLNSTLRSAVFTILGEAAFTRSQLPDGAKGRPSIIPTVGAAAAFAAVWCLPLASQVALKSSPPVVATSDVTITHNVGPCSCFTVCNRQLHVIIARSLHKPMVSKQHVI